MPTPAGDVIRQLRGILSGTPAFLAGSLVSADEYFLPFSYSDADVFTPTETSLMSTIEKLLHAGFRLDEKFSRVYARWLKYGLRGWHTNSIRLHDKGNDLEVNVVYKLIQRQPTTSLAQVLESFDFGLLAVGWDLEYDRFRDLRGYMFPDLNPHGPLPMLPNKKEDWENGFISQYNGLREAGRYAKYHEYGYDMSLVKPTLIKGYLAVAEYHEKDLRPEKHQLAVIFETLAEHIANDKITELLRANKEIIYLDSLDEIMEALE